VLVVMMVNSKSGSTFKEFSDDKDAELYWKTVNEQVSSAHLSFGESVTLGMYRSPSERPADARMDVTEGKAKKIKGVIIRAGKELKDKVSRTGVNVIDEALLIKAEQVIQDKAGDYLGWAAKDVIEFQSALDAALADLPNSVDKLKQMAAICYRIKGQGGTFGYQMVTLIADKLGDFLATLDHLTVKDTEVIQVHINSVKFVLSKGMSGAVSSSGESLLVRLEEVSNKILQKKLKAAGGSSAGGDN